METTIKVNKEVKNKLDKIKLHHRETYNELILRLINLSSPKNYSRESLIETIEVLSDPETMREIAEAVEAYNKGEGVDFEEIKKELKLNV